MHKSHHEILMQCQHASGHEFDTTPSLSSNVTISKAEHDYLVCLSEGPAETLGFCLETTSVGDDFSA